MTGTTLSWRLVVVAMLVVGAVFAVCLGTALGRPRGWLPGTAPRPHILTESVWHPSALASFRWDPATADGSR